MQKRASYIALATFYFVAIPLACLLVFQTGMGVMGLWIGMAVGITLQATFYTKLVLQTNWQDVADEAERKLLASNQAELDLLQDSFHSIHSYNSRISSNNTSFMRAALDSSTHSLMRPRD